MTLAENEITKMNRQLAKKGRDIVLRRYSGLGGARVPIDVAVRAWVDDYKLAELVEGISQGDSRVILSPTPILATAWPGPQDWPQVGDRVVIEDRERNVQAAVIRRLGSTVVRINLQVRG